MKKAHKCLVIHLRDNFLYTKHPFCMISMIHINT